MKGFEVAILLFILVIYYNCMIKNEIREFNSIVKLASDTFTLRFVWGWRDLNPEYLRWKYQKLSFELKGSLTKTFSERNKHMCHNKKNHTQYKHVWKATCVESYILCGAW